MSRPGQVDSEVEEYLLGCHMKLLRHQGVNGALNTQMGAYRICSFPGLSSGNWGSESWGGILE